MAKSSVFFSSILLFVFVVAISEFTKVNGNLCERESQTYSGLLCHNLRCDRRCIRWEKATHGACHLRNWKNACYCYFDTACDKVPPPSGGGKGGGKGDDCAKVPK